MRSHRSSPYPQTTLTGCFYLRDGNNNDEQAKVERVNFNHTYFLQKLQNEYLTTYVYYGYNVMSLLECILNSPIV